MFGTAKRTRKVSRNHKASWIWQHGAEIQAESYDRLWACKLSMFLMQRPLHLLLAIILVRSMAYSIPKSQKYLNRRLKLFPNGAIAATVEDGCRYPLYSLNEPRARKSIFSSKKAHNWRKEPAWWRDSDGMRMSEAVAGYR